MRDDGEVVGRVRSCAYGYTVAPQRRARDAPGRSSHRGAELTVDVFGEPVPARIERDVLYDPDGSASVVDDELDRVCVQVPELATAGPAASSRSPAG